MQPLVADKYRIVRLVGQGGMGEVYEAENTTTRRRVALKLVAASVATSDQASLRARERFAREARALGQIRSKHVVE
ncbi:MAG: serine/threonine protein kinase, partial [Polyangiaceae bacterium]|nr:serine/threonine protein kinase [Polyangiaceae bacterium]